MKKRCDTCKWFGAGCFDKECNYPELEAWEPKYPENLDRRCVDCIHYDASASEEPCKTCSRTIGKPNFKRKLQIRGSVRLEREEGIRTCSECKYRDLYFDEPPCDKCYGKTTHPKFERRIEVKLEGAEEVTEKLKRIIEKDQFLVGIVHPSYMEMHGPKIYYFESDYCLEEGMDVLVEGDDGTRAWGRVFVPSVPFENEQIEFIRDMGEEIGRVVSIFTPFHKCEE